MLAWTPSLATVYEPLVTAISLVVALIGCGIALGVGTGAARHSKLIGGGTFGLTVSAMHYTGMAGLESRAFLIFDPAYVVASIVLATVLGVAAFYIIRSKTLRWRTVLSSLTLVAAIVSLHFTGMGAITVLPMGGADMASGNSHSLLALGVAGVGLLLLAAARLGLGDLCPSRADPQARASTP